MRKMIFAALVSGLCLTGSAALGAEARYSSEDVIDFMLKQASLGADRGVCVGTAEECAPVKPAGFDVYVNFEFNSATLTPDAEVNLQQVASALDDPRLSGAKFQLDGYTDASGTEAYNLGLSQRRAQAVADFLVEHGIDAQRLASLGLGENDPRMPDPYDPLNRRVEMTMDLN
jgi:outer membrane protein OmpA-like peptidoglycan-associated protein